MGDSGIPLEQIGREIVGPREISVDTHIKPQGHRTTHVVETVSESISDLGPLRCDGKQVRTLAHKDSASIIASGRDFDTDVPRDIRNQVGARVVAATVGIKY